MKAQLIRIGNSRGIRIPQALIDLYGLKEADYLEMEERREGILIIPRKEESGKISWEAAYREMAEEAAEKDLNDDWDVTAGDGLHD